MIRRRTRRLLIAGGFALGAVVLAILLVPVLLPSDLVAEKVTREVEKATGARMTLAGAEVNWRGGWSVTLRDGTVRGTGAELAAATGSAGDLESFAIAFDEFNVLPALLPLLRRQLVVKSVALAGSRVAVRWTTGEVEAAGYSLRLAELNLGLDDPFPGAPAVRTGGSVAPGELIPPDLSFLFSATADTLVLERAAYTGLDLEGGVADRVVDVTSLSARRSTGTVNGALSVDFVEYPWGRLHFQVEAREVPAAVLLEPWAPDLGRRLEGLLNAEVFGGCDLRDAAATRATLDLAGSVSGAQGVLHAEDWLADITPYLGERQDLKDVRFETLEHEFRLVQGRYLIESLALGGGETEWRGRGWVDLAGNLAVGLDVKLPAGFTPDLGNFSFLAQTLRGSDGRINLPLTLSGRSSKPTVGVDLGRLGGR